MSNVVQKLNELYLVRQSIEACQAEIERQVPDLVASLENLKAQQAELEKDIKRRADRSSGDGRHTIPAKYLQVVLTSRTSWDSPALENLLGDQVDEYRKVNTFWSIRKVASK